MPGEIICALEDVYGEAPAAGWQSNGLNADGHKSRQDELKRSTLKRRTGAPTLGGVRLIDKGAEGTIEFDGATNGLGIYLACTASTAESALVGTDAYEQTFEWTSAGVPEGRSLASRAYRDRRDGTEDVWDYTGGKPTGVEIGQNLDGFVTFKFPMDYLKANRLTGSALTAALGLDESDIEDIEAIEGYLPYAWPDAIITLTPLTFPAGVRTLGTPEEECLSSFTVNLLNGADVEDWCLKRGTTKHEPTRSTVPESTGTLEWKYQHPRYYDAFRSGAPFALSANWEAPIAIEGSTYPSLTIDLATIVFHEANDPELDPAGPTMQSMPFAVRDDETGNPVATITYVTTDDADLNLGS